MLEWTTPTIGDGEWIRPIVNQSGMMGSDVSFANLFLLREKYNTEISHYKNFLIRKYHGTGSRDGYTFPIGEDNLEEVLEEIEKDAAKRGEPLRFCLLTCGQKSRLQAHYGDSLEIAGDLGDSDYLYLQQDLANLSGKKYHKKKNHVSKFKRTYPDYTFSEMGDSNLEDALKVQDAWYNEHMQTEDDSQMKEHKAISEALQYYKELQLRGGLIYVDGVPVAMTIASAVTDQVCDIHFEKSIGECALNGGYSAINQLFAQTLNEFRWINREEDINIEGLRKAKTSYHPKIVLKKYYAV